MVDRGPGHTVTFYGVNNVTRRRKDMVAKEDNTTIDNDVRNDVRDIVTTFGMKNNYNNRNINSNNRNDNEINKNQGHVIKRTEELFGSLKKVGKRLSNSGGEGLDSIRRTIGRKTRCQCRHHQQRLIQRQGGGQNKAFIEAKRVFKNKGLVFRFSCD